MRPKWKLVFSPFVDSANLDARYHRLRNHFGRTVLQGDEAQVKFVSVRLEIVLILTQDRSTVCVERTIGSEIILDTLDGTPW